MDRDFGEFYTNTREDDELDVMNIDFPAQTLLELIEHKDLEIILTSQFPRKRQERSGQYDESQHEDGKSKA